MLKTAVRHAIAVCGLAMVPVGFAQATAVYSGNAVASRPYATPVLDKGTGSTPAAYAAAGTGAMASSVSHDATGGSVESTAQTAGNDLYTVNTANALTTLTYRVDIVSLMAGAPGTTIPIHIDASGSILTDDFSGSNPLSAIVDATAQFEVLRNNSQVVVNQSVEAQTFRSDGFHYDGVLDFLPSDYLTVILRASASSGGSGATDAGYAYAFVDPTFTIDPSYSSFYKLVGVPGADAVTPPGVPVPPAPPGPAGVPEPATLALIFGGFGALVKTSRRQRVVVRPA